MYESIGETKWLNIPIYLYSVIITA